MQANLDHNAICIPNISVAEQRKRLWGGVFSLALSLAVLATLMATSASRWWRLGLLFFFWGGTLGFFQARDKT